MGFLATGFVKDPDADELIYVTESGEFSEEEIVDGLADEREIEDVEHIIDNIYEKFEKAKKTLGD